jgi:hypothetical protein
MSYRIALMMFVLFEIVNKRIYRIRDGKVYEETPALPK